MKIQWQGDNLQAVERVLSRYGSVRYHDASRKSLSIVAKSFQSKGGDVEVLEDVQVVVELGDTVHYKPGSDGLTDSIGVERPPDPGDDGEIVWTGDNPFDIAMFVRKHELTISMNGDEIILKESDVAKRAQQPNEQTRRATGVLSGTDAFIRMRRGDKLILKGGCLFMSRVGQEHRA